MQFGFVFPPLTHWRYAVRIYWPVWLGLVLMVGALGAALVGLPALNAGHNALARQARALQEAGNTPALAINDATIQPLSARLAPLSTLTMVTADMQALALKSQLQINTANFQPVNDPVLPDVVRVDIAATLRGAYLPTKKLLADMLAAHPALVLQSVALRRERSTDAVLEVETRWVLFCRKGA